MIVYYSGGGAWCRRDPMKDGIPTYTQLVAPSFIDGLFTLAKPAQRAIEYIGRTEVTYLLPCDISHDNAVTTPAGEDPNLLVFQLYAADNELTEKVYHKEDLINFTGKPDANSDTSTLPKSIQAVRVDFLKRHLSELEKAAKIKNLPFERTSLKCGLNDLFIWVKAKPKSSLFTTIQLSTFKSTWKATTGYRLCPPASVDKDFFIKIENSNSF